MIVGSILSSIGGVLTAIIQDFLHQKQDFKRIDKELEVEIKRKEFGLEEKKIDLSIKQEEAKISDNNLEQSENGITEKWLDVVQSQSKQIEKTDSKLVNFTNFYIATTRPTITYILLLVVGYCAIYFATHPVELSTANENNLSLLESLLYLLDSCLAYWFVRRSSEKKQFDLGKKKI